MIVDVLLANLRQASTNKWSVTIRKISLNLVVVFYCYFNAGILFF